MFTVYYVMRPEISSLLTENCRDSNQFKLFGTSVMDDGVWKEMQKAQPDILVIELQHPIYLTQNLIMKLHQIKRRPTLFFFTVVDNVKIYYVTTAESSPALSSFEEAFAQSLKERFDCTGMSYHDDTWNRLFEITPMTYVREDRLVEILRGVTVKSFMKDLRNFSFDLNLDRGFYLFICEQSYIENPDHIINHQCYNLVGVYLLQEFEEVLHRFNGGEVFYLSPVTIIMYINDFNTVSAAHKEQLLQQLSKELIKVGNRQTSMCFMSPYIESIEKIRSIYELYQRNKVNHFFCIEKRPMTLRELLPPPTSVDYNTVQRYLDQISDAVNYDSSLERAYDTIRYLFLSLIKSSFDLDLFYYCFNNIKRIILTVYPQAEVPLALRPKYGVEIMFDSIEQESEKLTALLHTLRQNNLPQSQMKHNYIYDTVQYIKQHYMTELTLSDIAAAVHMNNSYLTKKFKEVTGVSVIEYLTKFRINMAAMQLRYNSQSVAEIASLVGFVDPKHFSKVFKKHMGLTPLQYRKHASSKLI